jgi:TPR repeat protein
VAFIRKKDSANSRGLLFEVTCALLLVASFSQIAHAVRVTAPTWTPEIQGKAESGDADAQSQLCFFDCYQPFGVKPDCVEAGKWCRKSAEQHNKQGECLLGLLYEDGKGVKQDYAEAAKWYIKGECARGLAKSYRYGRGVKQDYAEAEKWYEQFADQGTADDQADFARFYTEGNKDISSNNEKAYFWMSLAAHTNHSEYDGPRDDIEKHLTTEQIAAVQKRIWDRVPPRLGMLRLIGDSKLKASHGDAQAQIILAIAYAQGDDVQRDYVEAYFWYSLAALHKDSKDVIVANSQVYANGIAAKLTPQQMATAKKLLKEWKPITKDE